MYNDEPDYRRFPRVPIERRAGAFLIDFVTIWLFSSFFGSVQWLVFLLGWLAMRVVLVDRNKGQSLGRWALDIKVIDPRLNKIPDLVTLSKREGIAGFAAMLAMFGLNLNFSNALSMIVLVSPLVIDCGLALTDEEFNRAFHDRVAETIIVQTQRGFSLDLRLKKLLAQLQRNMQK
jgi:uncharacterized RDD family membrane protein YckC